MLPVPRRVGCLLSLVLKMRFPPSVVKTKHGWRTAMHLEGRNEVENQNGACVMEVASLGSRVKIGAKEGGKTKSKVRALLGGMKCNGMQAAALFNYGTQH